ncbi:MAG: TM2 domain-containing protein [Gloeocapsa sp. DLM2.Bin57]|jgi:TM2 domain-containing membrane protein YozV|nr:MAG: TM2 domain-containing protein [Gloeocapsa sp. DLM2.Bin57]
MNNNSNDIKYHLNNVGMSYLLWLACLFGVAGLHRFYNKKIFTGLLWLCTWGFFGIGQFIDLFVMSDMVDEHNFKVYRKYGLLNPGSVGGSQLPQVTLTVPDKKAENINNLSDQELMVILTKASQKKQGKLSLTDAVIDTGITFEKAEAILSEMVKRGYISLTNHPVTGVLIYDFHDVA